MKEFNIDINLEETTKTLMIKLSGNIEFGYSENIQGRRKLVDDRLDTAYVKKLAFDLAGATPSDLLGSFVLGRYSLARDRGIETTVVKSSERVNYMLDLWGMHKIIPKEDEGETGI